MAGTRPVKSILGEIKYMPRDGALILNGARYLLIRPETLIGFQRELEAVVGAVKTAELLYKGGFEGGSRTAARLLEKPGVNGSVRGRGPVCRPDDAWTGREVVEAMCGMGTQIGWGAFSLRSFCRRSERFEFTVRSSVFAGAYGRSRAPVCHFISGVFGGVGSVVFSRFVKVREFRCASSGAGLCRFEAG